MTDRLIPERHRLLPANLNAHELAQWLDTSAVEKFTHEVKTMFTDTEISEFEHESSAKGREMNRLLDMLKEAGTLIKKGTDEPVTFTIPATVGTKTLETQRRENDDFIEYGYVKEERQIFGIIDVQNERMEYFDVEGNIIVERSRPLSVRERHDHIGMFSTAAKPNVIDGVDQQSGEIVDQNAYDEAQRRKAS